MPKEKLTPRERISKARINLLTDFPFFGSMAMKLVPRELTEQEAEILFRAAGMNPTMAVDLYGNLIYYPGWVEQQTDTVMKAGISHEVMHVALKHLLRIGTRDPRTWNIAVDAAVNEILSHSFKLPDEWVHIPQMAKKSAEEIYDWLLRNIKTIKLPKNGGVWDSHIFGQGKDGKDGDKQQQSTNAQGQGNANSPFYQQGQQEVDVPRMVREAYNFAKTQGKLPAGIERHFADILNPALDWKDILRKFIVSVIPHDFTYTRPSKKSYSVGFYMPHIVREYIELVIGVDSSGSISDEEYAEFLSEIYHMVRQFENVKAWVIVCDAAIQEVAEIDENFDPYHIHGRGYGGTSSLPVFKWIEDEKQSNIKILVYFTDGYIDIPEKEYSFPTLWIVTGQGQVTTVEKMSNATVIQMQKKEGREDDY